MKRTKICCLNIKQEICDYLSKTFEVYNGCLGKIVDVNKQNHQQNYTYLLLNHDYPENIHEYDVFISDLSNFEIIEYKNEDHQLNNIVGNEAYYFVSEAPATHFNPIPFGCGLLKEKTCVDGKNNRPIINIIFQYKKQSINYKIRDTAGYRHNDTSYEGTNYSHTKDFTVDNKYGKEVKICDNKIAKIIFENFTDEIEYHQTFKHPTKWDDNAGESILDPNFLPLLKNKSGQIVSYMWISEYEIAIMLPQLKSKKQLLDILFREVLFQYFSEYFPEIETKTWTRNHQYYLPEQQRLEIEKQEITKKYQEEFDRIDKELEAAANKYKFLHDILIETGDKLVKSVITYLKWLGFDNAIEKDKTATEGLLEEDIQIDLGEKGLLIIEVKGINGTSKDSECSQISKIKYRRSRERKRFDVFALYIVNNERNIEPLKRTIPPFNDNQIQDAINDDRGLMYTWQLFNLYFNVKNGFITKEEARNRILQTGLVDFTPTLKELGKPYWFYQNHTIICVELQNNLIHVGDTLAYEKDGRYYLIKITEIQQDKKPINEASDGKVGIKVNEKVPEIKTLYFVKQHIND